MTSGRTSPRHRHERTIQIVALILGTLLLGSCGLLPLAELSKQRELDEIAADFERGDAAGSVTRLRTFLEKNPDDDLAWTILGHAHEQLDEDVEAETAYTRALELNPDRFQALTGMGILSRKRGDYDGALSYYERALAIEPEYAQAYSSMTVIALKKDRMAQALEYAKRGYELDAEDATIAANLAIAYHYNGMIAERDRMTKRARELGYRNVETLEKIYSGELSLRD